jgi:hypothetical protein
VATGGKSSDGVGCKKYSQRDLLLQNFHGKWVSRNKETGRVKITGIQIIRINNSIYAAIKIICHQ